MYAAACRADRYLPRDRAGPQQQTRRLPLLLPNRRTKTEGQTVTLATYCVDRVKSDFAHVPVLPSGASL